MSASPKTKSESEEPRFTAKGEPTVDWLRHPKSFVDELIMKGKLAPGGVELLILLVIERFTWGAEGKPEYMHASHADLAKRCRVSPQAVADPLKRLESAGIISWIPKGDVEPGQKRGYRLTPENWHRVKVYKDPDAVKDRPAPVASLPVGFDEDQPGAIVLKPRAEKTINVPVVASHAGEFDLPVRLRNEVDLDLAFASVRTAAGLDVIVRRAASAGRTEGEYNNVHSPAQSDAHPPGSKRRKGGAQNGPLPTTVGNDRRQVVSHQQKPELLSFVVDRYRDYFKTIFHDELEKPLDEPFLKQIAAATGGAPVTYFDRPLAELRRRKLLTSGMILEFARTRVGPLWETRRKDHEAEQARLADACPRCKGTGDHPVIAREHCDVCHGSGKKPAENPQAPGKAETQNA